jgi:ABC-type transport system involved in cytochrome bd biosynthesis fused ATPase/permease subunit
VMVTHDPELADRADRIIQLTDGCVMEQEQQDTSEDIPQIAMLNGSEPLVVNL